MVKEEPRTNRLARTVGRGVAAMALSASVTLGVLPSDVSARTESDTQIAATAIPTATGKSSARAAIAVVQRAVATNRRTVARRYLGSGPEGRALWRALRKEYASQARLPTIPPSNGGPWRKAGQPWAKPGTTTCHRVYCAVPLIINALGTDGPYSTLYTRRSGTRTRVVATREVGPQDAFDYGSAYWACTRRLTSLTNAGIGGRESRLRLSARTPVQVGSYYMQRPSDPTRGVRFSRVVEGYVAATALLRVPSTVSSETQARTWCRANA
ncbi:MAG: hypothetical protein U0S36_02510 [Candidatus Nanopelagicales bacterium]